MKGMRLGKIAEDKAGRMAFWAILAFAVIVRCMGFGSIPGGVNQDEAMAAVDGWALAQYGTDRFGVRLPVHFSAWQYGQMSVLLSYCMVPFFKLLGFHKVAFRLPALLFSCGGVALVYLVARKLSDRRLALAVMALTAVNPWHFMQSRWALDCNLFPHVFLLAFWLLLLGLEKRRFLYLSMVFFGLTFYCYGIAVYSVIPFLVVYAVWCLWKRQLKIREVLLCILVFGVVALPEILVMAINLFHWDTIETPLFTMSYFPESIRGNDILFLNFTFAQLGRNILAAVKCCFLQMPDQLYNALPAFGPLYHISIPFMAVGIVGFTRNLLQEKEIGKKTRLLALWGFLLMGVWVGATTLEVNVNRINIIFYPLIFMCGYGLRMTGRFTAMHIPRRFAIGKSADTADSDGKSVDTADSDGKRSDGKSADTADPDGKRSGAKSAGAAGSGGKCSGSGFRAVAITAYAVCFALFLGTYFTSFKEQIKGYFNVNFLEAVKEADSMEGYEKLYITGNMDWQQNVSMAEILTQYACGIDALYFQGITDTTGGRELLPYGERYHFIDVNYLKDTDAEGLYLLHVSELERIPFAMETIQEMGQYVIAVAQP